MWFWRDENFKVLAEASRIASSTPAWVEYARYCDLLEKGLRKDALSRLGSFIEIATKWSIEEKKKFASWLYYFAHQNRTIDQLLPHPLRVNLLEPTLIEWIVLEPEAGEPHRWLDTPEHLEEAIRLDPADEIARERLINWLLSGVDYSTHELPYGYIRCPEEDLQILDEVEAMICGIFDKEKKAQYQGEVAALRKIVSDYLKTETET
jgi:hypothetical protein